ncbi:MAG: GNAT family protein [Terracidiphilus sp.]|nr:GNAT family protein [Terracidiphilus sp.]
MEPDLPLRTATETDLQDIIELERAEEARRYVGQWSEERHRATLTGGDARYMVVEDPAGGLAAYAILQGLAETGRAIELKRLVVGRPERGLGRKLLRELIRIAFEDLKAHRLFLDVFDDNARAQHLYTSMGFVFEGTMRHAASRDGEWHDLRLMSMLEDEFAARKSGALRGA